MLNLQHITLCEELGYLSGNAAELIEVVKVVFEKAHEKLPQMTFVVPSQESIYDVSNTSNPTVSVPYLPRQLWKDLDPLLMAVLAL